MIITVKRIKENLSKLEEFPTKVPNIRDMRVYMEILKVCHETGLDPFDASKKIIEDAGDMIKSIPETPSPHSLRKGRGVYRRLFYRVYRYFETNGYETPLPDAESFFKKIDDEARARLSIDAGNE